MFGYGLLRAFGPDSKNLIFRRLFSCLCALPRRYREGIEEYNSSNPSKPFVAQSGPTFTISRARGRTISSPNLTMQEVIHFFIKNRIPPSWVDHSYTYGLNAINHMATSPMSAPSIAECDNERHAQIQAYGVPPSIPEWDGWRHPTEEDMGIIQAQHVQRSQKSHPGYHP